jgi:hypothetical protein
MEPRRIAAMNRRFGFSFEQIGPTVDYDGTGESAVAAHTMDLHEVREKIRETRPDYYAWFAEQPTS